MASSIDPDKTYLISDLHFGHDNVYKFTFSESDSRRIRPWASNSTEGDEILIQKWNSVVGRNDLVFVVGDVTFKREHLKEILPRLNGTKRLIAGNHDRFRAIEYVPFFEFIGGMVNLGQFGITITHAPVHPSCLGFRWKYNIHGHLHEKTIPDSRYFNVSVESSQREEIGVEFGVPIQLSKLVEFFFNERNEC